MSLSEFEFEAFLNEFFDDPANNISTDEKVQSPSLPLLPSSFDDTSSSSNDDVPKRDPYPRREDSPDVAPTNHIDAIKKKIYESASSTGSSLALHICNKDLAVIYDNIQAFSEEELAMIPNVQIRGENRKTTHYFIKEAFEIMIALQWTCTTFNLPRRDVIKPFLNFRDKCFTVIDAEKNEVCTQERHHGCYACAAHKKARFL